MWFGESEKLIKGIFDKYRRIVDRSKVTPILLFNEADGIFSSRKQLGNSAVDQTENAIQNIILQEMEDLNGILIATTNLTQNLDKAFERRFLYKICFDKPTVNARFHIWKDKMPTLSERETSTLSEMFNLSGGQIDNIARKYLMKEVLHGSVPNLEELKSYCSEENLQTTVRRIGFLK
jgi:SpoVK/Ycf46/Vps4 family AAA+-type ATPase